MKRSSRFGNNRYGRDDLRLWNLKTLGPLFWAEARKKLRKIMERGELRYAKVLLHSRAVVRPRYPLICKSLARGPMHSRQEQKLELYYRPLKSRAMSF